jgi:hypothetical protein
VESETTPSQAPAQPSSPVDLKGLRALISEDESMVAMLIEDILHDLGCTVVGMLQGSMH